MPSRKGPSRKDIELGSRSLGCAPQGLLSDPNIWASSSLVGTNKSKFMPSVKEIKECYYSKFRGKGGEHDEPAA